MCSILELGISNELPFGYYMRLSAFEDALGLGARYEKESAIMAQSVFVKWQAVVLSKPIGSTFKVLNR
jgi:hypothetical protein